MTIAKEVELYDIDTGEVSLVSQESLGVEYVRIDLEGKIYWADSNKLKQNEYQHPSFEGERKARVSKIHQGLKEVNSNSYLEWEDGFRRDANPDNEIKIWEHIISIYQKHVSEFSSQQEKNDVYQVAVVCSCSEEDVVLDQIKISSISKKKAKAIVYDYYN